jgi:predicted enzyme related to lactoylglutathione lyase
MTSAEIRRMPGIPCWTSLMVTGLAAAEAFYQGLFGWEFLPGPPELGLYVRGRLDDKEIVGIGQLQLAPLLEVAWTPYMATDDADVTAAAIRSAGGTVGIPPLRAGRAGRLAIAADPAGAVFGLWEAALHAGTELTGVHGTPVRTELFTPETASVGSFYETVFGYELEAGCPDGAESLTLRLEGRPVATMHGVGGASARDRGPHWMTYFEVDDTDASARLVTELGGSVQRPPRGGPLGRFAVVADPEGAVFTIVRSATR